MRPPSIAALPAIPHTIKMILQYVANGVRPPIRLSAHTMRYLCYPAIQVCQHIRRRPNDDTFGSAHFTYVLFGTGILPHVIGVCSSRQFHVAPVWVDQLAKWPS